MFFVIRSLWLENKLSRKSKTDYHVGFCLKIITSEHDDHGELLSMQLYNIMRQ